MPKKLRPTLYLKIGNTRVLISTGSRPIWSGTHAELSKKRLEALLTCHFYVCSVVPKLERKIRGWVESAGGGWTSLRATMLPVKSAYREGLGFDRLLNIYSARVIYGVSRPIAVVDFGTATTVDFVSKLGVHQGGWILPGMDLSLRALSDNTAQIPASIMPDRWSGSVKPGKSTRDCLVRGQIFGAQALLRAVEVYSKELFGSSVRRVMTGGYSKLVVSKAWVRDLDLCIRGMKHWVQYEEKARS